MTVFRCPPKPRACSGMAGSGMSDAEVQAVVTTPLRVSERFGPTLTPGV